jgi:phosphatidate cytidylyltransferase
VNNATNNQSPFTKKPLMSQELKLRIVSAIVLAVIVLSITWIGGQTFTLLWAVAALLILREYNRICSTKISFVHNLASFVALFLIIAAWMIGEQETALIMFGVGFVVLALWQIVFSQTIWSACGLAYAALPFFAMSDLRSDNYNGFVVILLLYFCVWGADVFAYFTGRTIGGPKLAPRISPNKTWSGFLGSLVGALILSYLVDIAAGFQPVMIFFVIMLIAAVVSQLGDLMESSLKRRFDVKDSGSIIPGHGGVLDRVDGLVVAAVFLWLVSLYLTSQQGADANLPTAFVNAFLMP